MSCLKNEKRLEWVCDGLDDDKDYKLLFTKPGEQRLHPKGGHNKETIMLNIETFKKFCLKACTKKADEIHDYYIKLEETLQEVVHESHQKQRWIVSH